MPKCPLASPSCNFASTLEASVGDSIALKYYLVQACIELCHIMYMV